MASRVEYGIQCNVDTIPLDHEHFLPFRWYRWLVAHYIAWEMNEESDMYGCGRHYVVRRYIPMHEGT